MKNMSKTNKENLLKMNLQTFAAEDGLTTMNDLGEIKSIDFVNRFESGIKELLELLGVTRLDALTSDLKIQMYKWTTTLKDGVVAEGDDIPLSKVTRAKDRSYSVIFNKWRRAVSAESIARHGISRAIDDADNKLLRQIQGGIKSKFVEFLGTAPTTVDGGSLQKALANSWGKLSTFEEFEGAQFVSFVNPMDVAGYLGDNSVLANASNVFGMTLLKNFLGTANVVVLNAVPEGTVYSTAIDNIVLSYLDMKASDLGDIFVDFTDETGLISVTRDRVLRNATYEALYMGALVLYPEVLSGVVKAPIGTDAP